MTDATARLAQIDVFKDLPHEVLTALDSRLRVIEVARGETLIRQGDTADTLYLVISGRLDVTVAGRSRPVAHIGPGRPVGEIAFFAGGQRTATVTAARDSLVVALTRADFEALARRTPELWALVTADLARRLAKTNETQRANDTPVPRTVAVIAAGDAVPLHGIVDGLVSALHRLGRKVRRIAGDDVTSPLTSAETTRLLNALESDVDHLIYVADGQASPWSEKAIRQADLVLAVGLADRAGDARQPHALEVLAASVHGAEQQRLVLVHDHASVTTSGTGVWLDARPWVGMHHHVASGSTADFDRLARFIAGRAVGLVACGGGAYTAAQVGIHQALREAGVVFDILGGTSGGSAMAAAFALGASHAEIMRRSADMFVQRRAMRRWTVPRYSLIDHTTFDDALIDHFTDVAIEDLWVPYFAVSTNLTDNCLMIHRRGPLWQAIRASSAIPALLPPVFTADGTTLVDGALLDNVPVAPMHALKAGPNVVIHFELPTLPRVKVDHRALPSRRRLVWAALTRAGRAGLPAAPSPQAVLLHGLTLPRRSLGEVLGPEDLLFSMRPPDGLTHLDWHAQEIIRQSGYDFARARIAALRAGDDGVMSRILVT